jgi:hypothetical protein
MERFNLKKLNKVEGKEQYHVEKQIGSQIWTLMWILTEPGEPAERIAKFQSTRV